MNPTQEDPFKRLENAFRRVLQHTGHLGGTPAMIAPPPARIAAPPSLQPAGFPMTPAPSSGSAESHFGFQFPHSLCGGAASGTKAERKDPPPATATVSAPANVSQEKLPGMAAEAAEAAVERPPQKAATTMVAAPKEKEGNTTSPAMSPVRAKSQL